MFRYMMSAATVALFSGATLAAETLSESDKQIKALEQRLLTLEHAAQNSRTTKSANDFNPGISLILSGKYTNLSHSPEGYHISGFALPAGAEVGPGSRGFNLGESELGMYANIDSYLYGAFTLAITPEDSVALEEAFVQTTALSHGFTAKAGRFFSGIGYHNARHSHVWDFVDAPLAYQALLGPRYGDDGVQLKWLAPTTTFIEIGAEAWHGNSFSATGRDKNGVGAASLFAHVGGDVGVSHSWRAGVSLLSSTPVGRDVTDIDLSNAEVTNSFTGDSRLMIADFIWKYAPNGTAGKGSFQLQGEYLQRDENGDLTYDVDTSDLTAAYDGKQSGLYLQGIYQLMSNWRVGLRTDRLDTGTLDFGSNSANMAQRDFNPSKQSVMVEYKTSEFSRVRLQLAQDKSRQDITDNQMILQYQMSLGAHGSHQF